MMTHHHRRTIQTVRGRGPLLRAIVLLAAAGGLATGCATPHRDYADWEQTATTFVVSEGNDDVLALTDHHDRDGHRIFKAIGHEERDRTTDAVGVYVGQRQIDGQPWLIFLVGQVENRQLNEARVVAVTQQNGELTFVSGEPTRPATAAYNRYHNFRHATPAYTGWPRPTDAYQLSLTDDTLYVSESTTHAMWFLPLSRLGGE